ncbi:MAG: cell wall-active antibiotics response protein [Acidimicrobiia bacterium]|jgi:hypothetical protein|nr:cell wall-active antibiotics response protein [Acidimicrobiia bacterium]
MNDETRPESEEPTEEVPAQPAPTTPEQYTAATPSPPAPAAPRPGGPRLGHIVLGAVLVLIGVGWLIEALDVADVPWRFLLPSILILVGLALTLGARTGSHGGLIAVGVVLTVLVLLAGVFEVLIDIPLSGGVGDRTRTPTTAEDEYRWGVGKMTLDLRRAQGLQGEEIAASVVIGELVVIVPDDVPLVIEARAGLGEVVVLGESADGVDPSLECYGSSRDVDCSSSGEVASERFLHLTLEVGLGKVEVQR